MTIRTCSDSGAHLSRCMGSIAYVFCLVIEQFFLLFAMHSSIFIYIENIFQRLMYYRKDGRIPVKNREVLGNGRDNKGCGGRNGR